MATMPDEVCPQPPEVPLWAETPWRAWMELSGDRAYAVSGFAAPMGGMMIQSRPLPLSWAVVQQWCDRAGFGEEYRGFVAACVRAVDRAFLDNWAQEQARQGQGQVPGGNSVADKLARWDRETEAEEAAAKRVEQRRAQD